jgi:hypothetical protein
MKRLRLSRQLVSRITLSIVTVAALTASRLGATRAEPSENSFDAPHNQVVAVKMIGPVTQTTDLQVICVLKHDPAGDKYIEALDDLNKKLGGLLSGLRGHGDFVGDTGETLLLTPPANSITPKHLLLIGVGLESSLTLDQLRLAGRIAVREAVRLKASHVSFAPTLRDQVSTRIEVGEGDAAFIDGWIAAYDTEKRLQQQGLSAASDVNTLVIEAGPRYFDRASEHARQATQAAATKLNVRE